MENPKTDTRVVHSQTKSAWNVICHGVGTKFKIARIPYVVIPSSESIYEPITEANRKEAFEHAEYISWCFNNSDRIFNELKP